MELNSAVVWAAVCCCVGSVHADIVLLPSGNRSRHKCTQVRNRKARQCGKIPQLLIWKDGDFWFSTCHICFFVAVFSGASPNKFFYRCLRELFSFFLPLEAGKYSNLLKSLVITADMSLEETPACLYGKIKQKMRHYRHQSCVESRLHRAE